MIEVQEFITSLRSRLRDEAVEKNYSDNELIDFINNAYFKLQIALKLFNDEAVFDLALFSQKKQKLLLPPMAVTLNACFYNDRPVRIVSYEFFIKNKHEELTLSLNNQEILLSPKKDKGFLKINYSYLKRVANIEDYVEIKPYAFNAIIFYAMFLAFQKEPRVDSLQKSQYYLNLYEEEVKEAKNIMQAMLSTKDLCTEYQYV
ncbi:hypothetical protein [Helicobacter sp. 11S02596-1]|uniref:hypothetical protein n=1 Tax=Helicobacter sp. 11S02596-1 TaxID=1476194 RepID=UPI000BA66671|nr:hypothetical protein [Helicobacter sp. 11S02596-1]PAF41367.1 hypothetical protein BJI48_08735 [Helicobacter sp. 11S02596-1]